MHHSIMRWRQQQTNIVAMKYSNRNHNSHTHTGDRSQTIEHLAEEQTDATTQTFRMLHILTAALAKGN